MMRIVFKADINPKTIKDIDKSIYVYTDIYLDKDKRFPLIEVYIDKADILHKLGITRFMCVSGDYAIEVQTGEGNFYHRFKGVTYHRDFKEDALKDGKLHLYVKDRKVYY